MFTHQRIEAIQNKIKTSKLLSDQEKGDWLNLLDLMNDKQLGELEEILAKEEVVVAPPPQPPTPKPLPRAPVPKAVPPAPPKPTPPPPPVAKPAPPIPPLPPLKHIANVPSNMAPPNFSQPSKPSQSVAPVQSDPTAEPAIVTSTPEQNQDTAPLQSTSAAPYKQEHPEDLKNLTARDLRNFDLQSMVNAIKTTIAEHGYFPILQLIEQSPLYESYIKAGEMKLKGLPGDLNQSEFEFVTDLLIHMRFNRW